MKRLQVEINDPTRDEPRRSIGFDDPMEAHRFADEQARRLPANATVTIYDNEAQAYCGNYPGRAEPQDHADELQTLVLFGSEHAQIQRA